MILSFPMGAMANTIYNTVKSTSSINLNDSKFNAEALNVDGYTYLKLRDTAAMLNATSIMMIRLILLISRQLNIRIVLKNNTKIKLMH